MEFNAENVRKIIKNVNSMDETTLDYCGINHRLIPLDHIDKFYLGTSSIIIKSDEQYYQWSREDFRKLRPTLYDCVMEVVREQQLNDLLK